MMEARGRSGGMESVYGGGDVDDEEVAVAVGEEVKGVMVSVHGLLFSMSVGTSIGEIVLV